MTIEKKFYFIQDVEKITGRSRITLRRWWTKDLFPRPTNFRNRLMWHTDVVDEWVNSV